MPGQCECGRSAVGTAPNGKLYCEACANWKMHRWYATHQRQQMEANALAGLNPEQMQRIAQMRREGSL